MEAEYSDLLDRKLMSLYGISNKKPSKMDQVGSESLAIAENFKNIDYHPIKTADASTT